MIEQIAKIFGYVGATYTDKLEVTQCFDWGKIMMGAYETNVRPDFSEKTEWNRWERIFMTDTPKNRGWADGFNKKYKIGSEEDFMNALKRSKLCLPENRNNYLFAEEGPNNEYSGGVRYWARILPGRGGMFQRPVLQNKLIALLEEQEIPAKIKHIMDKDEQGLRITQLVLNEGGLPKIQGIVKKLNGTPLKLGEIKIYHQANPYFIGDGDTEDFKENPIVLYDLKQAEKWTRQYEGVN